MTKVTEILAMFGVAGLVEHKFVTLGRWIDISQPYCHGKLACLFLMGFYLSYLRRFESKKSADLKLDR